MNVGFIGLGTMGTHMARHLARNYPLFAFDVDRSRIEALTAEQGAREPEETGAHASASIAELGRESDVVLLSLPSSSIVEEVATGDDGLLGAMKAGSTIIDTSTTEPQVSRRIGRTVAERDIGFLDAPVSGGESGARDARLSIMVGGPEELVERYRPVLGVLGPSVVRVGDVGSGGVAKLVNNMIVASTFSVIAEGFALARQSGLDPDVLYRAIRGGWAGSAVLEEAAPRIVNRDFVPGGTIDLLLKDMSYALSLARSQNVPTPMTAQVNEVFKAAAAAGHGPDAQPAAIQLWEKLLGLE